MSLLVIRLKGASQADGDKIAAEWLAIDESGARQSDVYCGALSEAAALSVGRKVMVLIPGTDALVAEPIVPVKSGAKLAQVVPFALEEQLASDVDALHFAVGKRDERAGVPVVVVSHQQMAAWLQSLLDAGLVPDSMHAETAVLPATPNGVTLLIDDSKVYVRRETTPGAVLEIQPLIEALQLALASGDEAREHVTIYVGEDDYERERDLLEGLREFVASLQLRLMPGGALPLLAANAAQSAPVNLLQGKYATKNTLNVSFAPWRYAAALAVVFFVAHLGVQGWQHVKYQRAETHLDAEISTVFQQAMPGAPIPDPLKARKQVESRLMVLRGGGQAGGLMAALSSLGEAMNAAPGTNIEMLSYRDNVTELRVLAPSVDALDKIKQAVVQHGVVAEIQSATPRESKTEARLHLKTPGV